MTSAALLAHYAGDALTLATLVTVTRRDGVVATYTNHDTDIVFGGYTYKAGTYTASAVASGGALAVDNLEIAGPLGAAVISAVDVVAGLWDYARVRIEEINWADLSMGSRILRTGTLGEISAGQLQFRAELRGLTQHLQQTIGRLASTRCRADLGDARCGKDITPYTVTGTLQAVDADNRTLTDAARTEPGPSSPIVVTGITNAQYAVVSAPAHGLKLNQTVMLSGVVGMTATELINGQTVYGTTSINGAFATVRSIPDSGHVVLNLDTRAYSAYASGGRLQIPGNRGYFDGGKITFTSGANAGRSMEVKAYVPGLLVLAMPMPYPLAVGDAYSLTPGCGRRIIEDCVGVYNNAINFDGEPCRPGTDDLYRSGQA